MYIHCRNIPEVVKYVKAGEAKELRGKWSGDQRVKCVRRKSIPRNMLESRIVGGCCLDNCCGMHHNAAICTTLQQAGVSMVIQDDGSSGPIGAPKRVTVTLAAGQYEQLAAIAEANKATIAYVVRRAVTDFIGSGKDRQLLLRFPE